MAELSYPNNQKEQTQWSEKRMDDLYQGQSERFFYALDYLIRHADDPKIRDSLKSKRAYFRKNQH